MTELPSDIDALEAWFERHHIARRHLRPRWMRLCRAVGLNPGPPLFFTLPEHFLWEGLPSMLIVLVGYLICWWTLNTPPLVLVVLLTFGALLPITNWTVRRRLRKRIDH